MNASDISRISGTAQRVQRPYPSFVELLAPKRPEDRKRWQAVDEAFEKHRRQQAGLGIVSGGATVTYTRPGGIVRLTAQAAPVAAVAQAASASDTGNLILRVALLEREVTAALQTIVALRDQLEALAATCAAPEPETYITDEDDMVLRTEDDRPIILG